MSSPTVLHRLANAAAGALGVESRLPGFDGATGWLNSQPLTEADLQGKVVLVDFWTYTCINWLRTLAHVRAWSEKYESHGLVVVGVHTPEFPFERDADNVRWAVSEMAVDYPVALDSDYAVWDAFANRYWPAVYIADAQGRIRHHHFGEGAYEECERVVQQLLGDTGDEEVPDDLVAVEAEGFEVEADWANLRSPETYLGYERGERYQSGAAPGSLGLNQWDLSGDWTLDSGSCVLNGAGGQITYRFHARDVHLVMSPAAAAQPVPFRVLIDGQPPGDDHGLDVDEQGRGTVVEQRLYGLVRQRGPIADRTIEISFPEPGVEAYVFTFG